MLKVDVHVASYTLCANLSITYQQIIKGLSIKDSLKENEGMLFVLPYPSRRGFWMKNMKFSIDIIWLNTKKRIIHIEKSLEPCISHCHVFYPKEESKYVLETVAGFTDKHNLKEKDIVFFQLKKD